MSKWNRQVVLFATMFVFPSFAMAQPGRGGPDAPDQKIVKKFDLNKDGVLNKEERGKAREALRRRSGSLLDFNIFGGPPPRDADQREAPGRGGRRRGPGGFGPGGRGPGGRGGTRPRGTEGPAVIPSDVKAYPDRKLYDPNVLRTLFIDFEQDDWEAELADFKPTDVEVPATLLVDGKKYSDVGVSFRGASSYFSVPAGSKRSLNLSLDYLNDKQRLYGYKTLNLLNCNGDSSLMSSFLYSSVTSKKIATPKVNFVKVVINGRSWGIYTNVQQFNKEFIEENFGTRKGARWKVSGSPRGDAGLRYMGDDIRNYQSRYEIKSKDKTESWEALIELCRVLNETPLDKLESALNPILDIDGTLWFLAADVALNNSDGYWTRASDYSIYRHPSGKFHILPHDMNEAFRSSGGGGGPGGPGFLRVFGGGPPPRSGFGPPSDRGDRERRRPQANDSSKRERPDREFRARGNVERGFELDPFVGMTARFPLRSRLLSVPSLRKRYLEYLGQIAREHVAWEKLGPIVSSARILIENEVNSDTRKLMTNEDFSNAVSESQSPKSGSLQEFAEKRSKFLIKTVGELSRKPSK